MPCFEEDIKKASVRCGRGFSYWDTMNPNGQHVTKQAGKQALSGKHTGKVQEGTVSQAGAGSRPSSKQAAKQAAKQASKQASQQASKPTAGQAERSSKQAIRIPPEAAAAEAAAAAAANQQHQTSSIMRRSSSSSAACAGGFGDWGRSECCNSVQEMRAHQFMPIISPAKSSSSSSTSSTIRY